MACVIVTDSGCDLTRGEAERMGIDIVPVWIIFDDGRFRDGVDIDRARFFSRIRAGEVPKTEPASVQEYRETFARRVEEGNEVVCVALSSGISKSYENAREAAKTFGESVVVIDSLGASGIEDLIALYALELVKSGASAAEIARKAAPKAVKGATFFAVPDLTQLGRSGRLPKAVVALGSMLNVNLVLKMNDVGAVAPAGQTFSFEKAIDIMVEALVRAIGHAPNARVAFGHVEAPGTVDAMRKALHARLGHPPFQEIVHETSLTLAAHIGIGGVGISAIVP